MIHLLLAILIQAAPDDPPDASAKVDGAVKSIPGYQPGGMPIGDADFLARLMGDLVGAPPTAAEVAAFVADNDPKKRTKKIDQLLDDPRYGPFWADRFSTVFFGDLSQVRFQGLGPLGEGVEEAILPDFRKWLAQRFQKDKPWTEIVNNLLDARGTTAGDAALAYKMSMYREPGMEQTFAERVSRHFLGIRLTCARCHDHPFDKWRVEDYYGLADFVYRQRARVKDGVPEITHVDEGDLKMPNLAGRRDSEVKLSAGGSASPIFLFGGQAGRFDDRAKVLAQFMTNRANTQLPRTLANRVWSWLMGWGIVHPIDDFNLKNKALSPALMETLVRDLIDNGYSLKRLLRTICNSQEYQMPLPQGEAEATSFRHLAARRYGLGRYEVWAGKPVARLSFDYKFPESWAPVRPRLGGISARFMHRVPDPNDPSRNAELLVFEAKPREPFVSQFEKPKTATSTVEGKVSFALSEISGAYTCRLGSDGPLDYAILTARSEGKGTVTTYRLEGPADLVAWWREEFLALLKSAGPR